MPVAQVNAGISLNCAGFRDAPDDEGNDAGLPSCHSITKEADVKTKVMLALSLVAATGVVYATGSSASGSGWTVERYYTAETWNSFADIGGNGGGPGDVYTSQQTLKTVAGNAVGVVNGYGVNLHKPYVFFHWTATLGDGSLTLEGAIDLQTAAATYAIEGGTGRYAAARGTVTLTDAGKNRSLAIVRYRQ